MRKTRIEGLSFDTIKIEGSIFTTAVVEKAATGDKDIPGTSDSDYALPRGLRLLDEIGRSFLIARATAKSLEEKKLNLKRFNKELFMDALVYTEGNYALLFGGSSLWQISCDGTILRLIRKSTSLARPSFLEFNLGAILKENRFSDYQMFYRIMHGTRALGIDTGTCLWDEWKRKGEELGVRVRDGLRNGVNKALIVLGRGFVADERNEDLRQAIQDAKLSAQGYFQELLRLMFRFLFLFTLEERGLVFLHGEKGHTIYNKGYSLHRLIKRSPRFGSAGNYGDLWEGIKIVFRLLGSGPADNPLDIPVLGGLFKNDQCEDLDKAFLSNSSLLEAMYDLRWTVDQRTRTLVDYKNMGSEELGSVYESLLELIPEINLPRRDFTFMNAAGNSRKTTGSYYTDDSLVQCLIKSNLDPLIEERLAAGKDKEKTLLSITVIDPACGSGHFLMAAARRLAEHLAFIRHGAEDYSADEYRNALRDVISSCIYGVDINPMAVELARMALWLEGYEPGKALSFLDNHIVCGNSLAGVFDFDSLEKGIPDDAYKALAGDDKEAAAAWKKANAKERNEAGKQGGLFENEMKDTSAKLTTWHWRIANYSNNDVADAEEKQRLFNQMHESAEYRNLKLACDLYMAAFYAEKKKESADYADSRGFYSVVPTTGDVFKALSGQGESAFSEGVIALAEKLAAENRFFHWRLEFPEIFANGGFDCVVGNPPWERIKLQEKEFFASRKPEIADAPNKAKRDDLIFALKTGNEYEKALYDEFTRAVRASDAASAFTHVAGEDGGRYPLTGTGDVNMYALFAETILDLKNKNGHAGFIVPTGIATDDSTKRYFARISGESLMALYDFENKEGIFPDVHRSFKFSLVSLGIGQSAELAFFLTNTKQLEDDRRCFTLTHEEFALLNPNTHTCPVFRSKADAELTKKIYHRVPILIRENSANSEEVGTVLAERERERERERIQPLETRIYADVRYVERFRAVQDRGRRQLMPGKLLLLPCSICQTTQTNSRIAA